MPDLLSLDDLPDDCLQYALSFLELADVGAVRQVCRAFCRLSADVWVGARSPFALCRALKCAPVGLRRWVLAGAAGAHGRVDNDDTPAVWHAEVRELLARAPPNTCRSDKMPAGIFWNPRNTIKSCIQRDSADGLVFLAARIPGAFRDEDAMDCFADGSARALAVVLKVLCSDKPQDGKPHGDKPQDDKLQDDKPQDDKPRDDKPRDAGWLQTLYKMATETLPSFSPAHRGDCLSVFAAHFPPPEDAYLRWALAVSAFVHANGGMLALLGCEPEQFATRVRTNHPGFTGASTVIMRGLGASQQRPRAEGFYEHWVLPLLPLLSPMQRVLLSDGVFSPVADVLAAGRLSVIQHVFEAWPGFDHWAEFAIRKGFEPDFSMPEGITTDAFSRVFSIGCSSNVGAQEKDTSDADLAFEWLRARFINGLSNERLLGLSNWIFMRSGVYLLAAWDRIDLIFARLFGGPVFVMCAQKINFLVHFYRDLESYAACYRRARARAIASAIISADALAAREKEILLSGNYPQISAILLMAMPDSLSVFADTAELSKQLARSMASANSFGIPEPLKDSLAPSCDLRSALARSPACYLFSTLCAQLISVQQSDILFLLRAGGATDHSVPPEPWLCAALAVGQSVGDSERDDRSISEVPAGTVVRRTTEDGWLVPLIVGITKPYYLMSELRAPELPVSELPVSELRAPLPALSPPAVSLQMPKPLVHEQLVPILAHVLLKLTACSFTPSARASFYWDSERLATMGNLAPFLRRLDAYIVADAIRSTPALAGLFIAEAMDVGVDAMAVLGPAGPAAVAVAWASNVSANTWTAARLARLHAAKINLEPFLESASPDGLRYAASVDYEIPTKVLSKMIQDRCKSRGPRGVIARLKDKSEIRPSPAVFSCDGWLPDV